MTSPAHQPPKRPLHLVATVVVLAIAALAVAVPSSANKHNKHKVDAHKHKVDAHKHKVDAHKHKVDGVRAKAKHGTLEVNGDHRPNAVALRLKTGDPNQIQVDVGDDGAADFSFARSDISAIDVEMGRGDDSVRVDDADGAFTDSIPTEIDGGDGDDALNGGLGAETFESGDGDDTVIGGKGDDTADLGSGNDTFRWDPGDGSDVIEGQRGSDTMLFNGAAANEDVTLTANAGRLTFFRDVGKVTMDTDGVETVDFNALGGSDKVTVNDLTGTDVTRTNLDLAGTLGGSTGDGAVDNVVVNGTNDDDTIDIDGSRSGVDVTGLATAVSITHEEPTDLLSVNTLGGKNSVSVNGVAGLMQLVIDGVRSA